MGISLRNIATELNISTAAASRALNDRPGVSDELRAKVKETAGRLGHSNHAGTGRMSGARPSNRKGLQTVAVLYGHIGGNILAGLQRGMDDLLRSHGYQIRRFLFDPDREAATEHQRECAVKEILKDETIVGIMACYIRFSDVQISALYKQGKAVVLLESPTEFGRCVLINQARGAAKAVMHFVETGRRHIGLILPPEDGGGVWQARLEGYRTALHDKGLMYHPDLTVYAEWLGSAPGAATTRKLLAQAPSVDAVLYGSDSLAAGGLLALRAMNRSVPDDIAVIGFDDDPMNDALVPPLASVRQPFEKTAAAGVGLLLDSLEKGDASHRVLSLETELVLRVSGGPGRSAS